MCLELVTDKGCREPHCNNGLIRRIKLSEPVATPRVRVSNQYDVADRFKERVDEMVQKEDIIYEILDNCEHFANFIRSGQVLPYQASAVKAV